ncbi:MAG: hypothetical protein NTU79_00355 [Planctomycetota bacterium]|nr:hypothetical protein [Planctomycetota bacterium]
MPAVPGVPVRQCSFRSPSQRLTVAELILTDSLPGRGATTGFFGGTVIAEGFYSTDAELGVNVFLANHIQVDPGEMVLIGAVTGNNGTTVQVNTVDVVPLTDPRFSTNPISIDLNPIPPTVLPPLRTPLYKNASGFPVTLESITPDPTTPQPAGASALPSTAVQGYFADGKMHASSIAFGGAGLLAALADPMLPIDHPRISIERADVRDLGTTFDIEVRGFITAPPPFSQVEHILEFRVRDMKTGTFGTLLSDWKYRVSEAASEITGLGTVRVDLRTPGATLPNGTPNSQIPPVQRWRFRGSIPKAGYHLLPPERIEVRNFTAEFAVHLPVRAELDTDVRVN